MDAIVFASFVPTIESLSIAKEYLDVIKDKFSDCDIYIGINYGTIPEWKTMLDEYGKFLSMQYAFVTKELNIDSDASAYQLALKLMSDSKKSYKLVWFMHTKGVTKNRDYIRNEIFTHFLSKRTFISKKFLNNESLGSYGRYITSAGVPSNIGSSLEKLYPFQFLASDTFYLYSFYVLRGDIVYMFIHNCDKDFFKKNLVTELGYNRYFFESMFPAISDMMGYNPGYDIVCNHPYRNIVNRNIIDYKIKQRNKNTFYHAYIYMRYKIGLGVKNIIDFFEYFLSDNVKKRVYVLSKKILAYIGIIQRDF